MPSDLANIDAEVNEIERTLGAADHGPRVAGFPPYWPFAEEVMREFSFGIVLRLGGKFFVAAERDDAGPLLSTGDLVGFDADERIGTHPCNFLPDGRKTVEGCLMAGEIEWRDVGLSGPFACEPSETDPLQELDARKTRQLFDQHRSNAPMFVQ